MFQITTKAEAKRLGLKRYFTGKPCINGHISERYAMGQCVQCNYEMSADPLVKQKRLAYRSLESNKRRRRDRAMRAAYGISIDEFDTLIAKQNGKCAICLTKMADGRGPNSAVVDHCHTSGRVRGILCSNCNTAIGLFKEQPDRLLSAIKYLGDS